MGGRAIRCGTSATSRVGQQGADCGEVPAIYIDVTAYRSWIDEVIANEGDPCYGGAWRDEVWSYPAGSIVTHNGWAWEAVKANWGGEPGGSDPMNAWHQLTPC